MAIFHLITVTPVTNHPQAKEHLELGNFMVRAADLAAAWNVIKDRTDVLPASEVWAAQTDESQQVCSPLGSRVERTRTGPAS